MAHCFQNCNLISLIIYGSKKYFSIFSSHFLKKLKKTRKFGKLNSNYFPRRSKLFNFRRMPLRSSYYIETTKPQGPDSVAPSLPGTNKCFLQSVSNTICILYNIFEQSHAQRPLPSLISKNLWAPYLIH